MQSAKEALSKTESMKIGLEINSGFTSSVRLDPDMAFSNI